ncbi:MAG: hypothetical protein J6K92_13325 [Oscillospiraceae bacterium]|nr:hypothetical protein [Oscillospiraceae bacterium]
MANAAFVQEWLISILLFILGAFFIAVTYAALIQSKRSGKFISGTPCIGGICISIAAILSPWKMLCLLSLLNIGIWEMLFLCAGYIRQRIKPFPEFIGSGIVAAHTGYMPHCFKVVSKNNTEEYCDFFLILMHDTVYELIACDREFNVKTRIKRGTIRECMDIPGINHKVRWKTVKKQQLHP